MAALALLPDVNCAFFLPIFSLGMGTGQDNSGSPGSPSTHFSPHFESIGLKTIHAHNIAGFKVQDHQAVSGNSGLYLVFSNANVNHKNRCSFLE